MMRKLFSSILTTLICCAAFAQVSRDSIVTKFKRYRDHHLQEKVYVHSDNDFYIAGERMFISVYAVDGSFHKPLDLSKVVYVELIDENKRAVAQAKVEMNGGRGAAQIIVPSAAESGVYVLRAYTSWMRNFPPEFYFNKTINVVNTFKQLPKPVVQKTVVPAIRFFPEGGNLVAGVPNNVAFKITDAVNVTRGFIVSQANSDTVVRFTAEHSGAGTFQFKPVTGEKYIAYTRDDKGHLSAHEVPTIHSSGYALQAVQNGDNVEISVTAVNTDSRYVYLFVHARNIIEAAEKGRLVDGKIVFELNRKTLQQGISHITLFDEDGRPQCERLIFKPVTDLMSIKLRHDSQSTVRNKVDLTVNVDNSPVKSVSKLSLAVYQVDSLSTVPSSGIPEYIWLTSELNGVIEDPSYYLAHPEDTRATDLLMLTHGWRRFKWEEVLSPALRPAFLPEYAGHLVKGKVTKEDGTPSTVNVAYLASPGKRIRTHAAIVTASGDVRFQTHGLYGSKKLIVEPATIGEDFKFTLTDPFSSAFAEIEIPLLNITRMQRSALLSRSIAVQARDLYRRDILPKSRQTSDSLPFYGYADNSYQLDDYTRFPTMEDVLREYVPKVHVRKRKDHFYLSVTNVVNDDLFRDDPLILLDGVPVTADQILQYNPLNVKQLDVIARRYYFGAASVPGIVSFRTYKGDMHQFTLDPTTFQINYEGLENAMEFFSPTYDKGNNASTRVPDLRYLLHWDPDIIIDNGGEFVTGFFTSDIKGKYVIVVEGISDSGRPGRAVGTFTVGD